VPAATVLLLGSLRLENIIENAHFLLHQSLEVISIVDIRNFVVEIEFLSPHTVNFHV